MSKYTEKITNYHATKPLFEQHIDLITRPFTDIVKAQENFIREFDLDKAVGVQLDVVGEWVGRGRNVSVPITNVYFSWDTEGLGWDQGSWKGPFDPDAGFTQLSDDVYRMVLKAQIAINTWDGTIGHLEDILEIIFAGSGIDMQIIDNQDMSITINAIAINGIANTSAELISVIKSGELNIKAGGVRVKSLNVIDPAHPLFGFDTQSTVITGYDAGYWS
ncbi:TPA: DUF2612 domain-containing protein [Enterobacter bugandensis]|uniref:DUF2612 domain-containing protein n=1 Tax=Enterobacter hormaechei TaxID=158836 RepID=UPI0018661A2D|nr:DUF2612 domain-containing protein [Enterobacter hormaechei]MBE2983194.1 DUF2612 domain-containing protein [Enterobacter hormaechei]MBJ6448492.1 DUF2612 domain-containing protein [Enterobacter hormaechei]MCU3599310.1 DUF2612 domain-containing protein [Enterobacter hormaechei subsp. hoffmannii]